MKESYSIAYALILGEFLEWWCIPNAHVYILKLTSYQSTKLF